MSEQKYQSSPFLVEVGQRGYVEGLTLSDQSDKTKQTHYVGGLPYALSPTGEHRFRRPRQLPKDHVYGTKDAPGLFTGSTGVCPQPDRSAEEPQDRTLWEEDCLQLNIHIPANKNAPANGWPVLFYIHGGFLQWGNANTTQEEYFALLTETAFEAIIVMPAYRLNAFGFLASDELISEKDGPSYGNSGFWDQRMALEWVANNISYFGGDSKNITVAGYSAGSYSAFYQLAYELYFVSDEDAVIRRTIMWSNGPGVQPRTVEQQQTQFDELLEALNIPLSLSGEEKLAKLRAIPADELVDVQDNLARSEFRATSDGRFVSEDLMSCINNGEFAKRMKKRGMQLMNGECREEHNLYRQWRTPSQSYDAVATRLVADYPESVVHRLLHHYCGADQNLPAGVQDWQELFGLVYADMQVHCLERGFHKALYNGGLIFGKDVLRYRIDWRASNVDMPEEWGVTHASDIPIWFYGVGTIHGLNEADKTAIEPFNRIFSAFVKGELKQDWGTKSVREMLRLRSDGDTDIWPDDRWDRDLAVWDLVNKDA